LDREGTSDLKKIGIYAYGLRPGEAGGVESYFRNLVQGLAERRDKNRYYIFLDDEQIKNTLQHYASSSIRFIDPTLPLSNVALWHQPNLFARMAINRIGRAIVGSTVFQIDTRKVYQDVFGYQFSFHKYGLDVIHFPFTTIPPCFINIDLPIVLSMHDIQQEYHPEFFDPAELKRRKELYQASAERADLLLTISEASKRTLIERFNINPKKIVVTYLGCSKEFKKIEDRKTLSSVKEKYELPSEFILYPAATWPHKNHVKLLEALSILRSRYSLRLNLVLTGIPKNHHQEVLMAIDRHGLGESVQFLKFVPFADLPVIYNLATILVFPSVFEGFGMPLVEAMSVGLPIACSDRTSIPEVVGDSGLYFSPESPADMADKIHRLWNDKELQKQLAERGLKRAELFEWKKGLETTVAVYNRCQLAACPTN
jgi:glycosyltransferase involved in cell wall biosynthesis